MLILPSITILDDSTIFNPRISIVSRYSKVDSVWYKEYLRIQQKNLRKEKLEKLKK